MVFWVGWDGVSWVGVGLRHSSGLDGVLVVGVGFCGWLVRFFGSLISYRWWWRVAMKVPVRVAGWAVGLW